VFETPEALEAHRELQLLRAAGVSASHRRRKRRPKPTNKSAAELRQWVKVRNDKLDEHRLPPEAA
jgi:hypothetical protein